MPLTVVTDAEVKGLLQNLNRVEIEELQNVMRNALHDYATGTTNSGLAAENQPNRQVIESNNGTTTLFMPSTSSSSIGMKVVTLPAPSSFTPTNPTDYDHSTPFGALTLMDAMGKPFGFLNAEELTAFRTAIASSLLITRRSKVKTITCFGCGKQAYWHVRLTLLLRGSTIKKVNFINRDFNDRAIGTMKRFLEFDAATKLKEGWTDTKFDLASLKYGEIERILKDQVRSADIIFCTTPSTEPLFDHTILTNTEGRKRPRLIIATGSYKPHMIEVPPEVVSQAVKVHGAGHHFHKRAEEGGVIVVDTLACLTTTGELVQGGVKADKTVELGELVMLEHMEHEHDNDDTPTPTSGSSAIDDSPHASFDNLALSPVSPVSPDGVSRSMAHVFREDSTSSGGGSSSKSPSRKTSFSLSRKSSFSLRPRTGSTSSMRRKKKVQTEAEDQMSRWLSGGNVIYKSVGMGLMDLVIGGEIVKLARSKGIGTTIKNF